MHELASQSLDLVNRELTHTLESARGEIEDYVEEQSDSEALVRAASMLHLAAGALKLVELHGAALLAEEMEQTCNAIHENKVKSKLEAVEALTRAMVRLPAYLERLMNGGIDVALVLLPILNDLRTSRNMPLLSEGTLLLLNTSPFERLVNSDPDAAKREFGTDLPKLAKMVRPKFQAALLLWFRGNEGGEWLDHMIEVADAIAEAAESEHVRQLWAVTTGVLIALRNGELEGTVAIKRLLGQVDRQLKRLIDKGEQDFISSPPLELMSSLFYYIARVKTEDERILELRRSFAIDTTVMPDSEKIERASEELAGPSVHLMRTVAEAIREDLGHVKDVLDIFVRTGMHNVGDLSEQVDMLKKIGDTLGVLGLDRMRERIQSEGERLAQIVAANAVEDPDVLDAIATALLDIEDTLDRELVGRRRRESGEAAKDDEDSGDSTQIRHVTQAVMRECIVNLNKIKEAVMQVLADPDSARALDQVEPQMRGIVAGLLMLNKNRAVNVIERIGRNITTRLAPGAKGLDPSLTDRLADAIVSIEYYMETIALGRADPFYMLDNANRCLDLVEAATAPRAAATRLPPDSEAATQVSLDGEAGIATELAISPDLGPRPGAAETRAGGPEAAGGPEPPALEEAASEEAEPEVAREEEPQREPTIILEIPDELPVLSRREERSEPELVEIFIEEAKEELAKIREQLPRWIALPEDEEALIAVRRSFHTLKGSGRVVGAQLLSEYAWSIENLLNRIINRSLEPVPVLFDFIRDAADALPELIDQLEVGIKPSQDIAALIDAAERLAAGEVELPAAAPDAASAQAGQAGTEAEAIPTMDPVLKQIFLKEVSEHLQSIREFVARARALGSAVAVSEPLHRACHTLYGSARMADFGAAIELAKPLDSKIREAYESGVSLDADAIELLDRFCTAIERVSAGLEKNERPLVDTALVAEIEALVFARTAATEAEPRDLEAPAFEDEAVDIADIEAGEIEAGEIEAVEVDGGDVEPVEPVEPVEIDIGDEETFEFEEIGAEPDEVESAEVEPAEVESAEVESAEVESAEVEPAEVESAEVESAEVVSAAVEAGQRAAVEEAEAVAEPTDYDPEIAAIFCDEASELLEQAEQQLEALMRSSGSDAPLAELKRQLHTLKGGARLAGIMAMGDLSHAFETMLPKMVAASSDAESDGMLLAQQALDRLNQMRDAVDAGGVAASARDLVAALERFGTPGAAAAPPAAPTAAEPGEPAVEEEAAAPGEGMEAPGEARAEREEAVESAAALDDEDREPTENVHVLVDEVVRAEDLAPAEALEAVGDEAVSPALPAAAQARGERAEMARVDAALLDELLNEAGEISIFQSRLNQQVRSIEFHLGELGQTVTRLREQLRKLEAETEAQILHRHEGEADADEHFDPLELDRYSTIQQLSRALAETSSDVASINELLQGLTSEADTLLTQQSRVTTDLQDGLMQSRMVSFDRHATRLKRIVRQAAQDSGKAAELIIEGAQSQVDRQILEAMVPALEHLLRNAVVHGIERQDRRAAAGKAAAGQIVLKVKREGSEVLIDVSDDGAGLDLNAIRRRAQEKGLVKPGSEVSDDEVIEMILLPGFSTADELTQAAGRGVGMDVVDNEVKRLGGSLRIETEAGKGTRFVIRLPYTLAITHALIVNVGEETFALPLPTVEGITRVPREQILELLTEDDPRLMYGDVSYRLLHLGSLVDSAPSALPEEESAVSLVLVRAGDNSAALLTDSLEGSREIIVKTLGPHIGSISGVSGATILGDGRVVVILDAGTLVRSQPADAPPKAAPSAPPAIPHTLTALVVDDSITMRRVTERLLERRGVKVLTARDGLDAIEVLRENEADFILLDIEMPRMDGYQFAKHVRNDEKLRDMPIIMVTSRSGEKHRARAIEIGVNDYLSKPYQEADLVAAIEALIGRTL